MTERGTEGGAGGSDDVAARVAALLTKFEERCDRLEDGLASQVERVRGSAEAIDMLTDEVRRSLQRWQEDSTITARLSEIERLLGEPKTTPEAPRVDLAPVTSALAEVLEAVALQSETARTDRRVLQDEVETLRSEVSAIPGPVDLTPLQERLDRVATTLESATPDPVDLTPIERRIAALTEAVTDGAPEPIDLSELHDHLDQLAQHVTASAPRPVDLAGVTSSIVGLHQRIDALIARPDVDLSPVEDRLASIPERAQIDELLARIGALDGRIDQTRADLSPVLDRLDALAETVDTQRPEPVDLAPVSAAIADLRTHMADSRPDLAPIREALAEVVDALAHQVDDTRSSSAASLAAIEALADRVEDNRVDLEPIHARLASLADTARLDDLRRRIDDVARITAEHTPEPVDLTPLTTAIADLRTHIADSRPDLTSLQQRLDELTDMAGTAELRERLDEVGRRIDGLDSRLDLAPMQHALAEVVDALAQQIDDSRSSSANSLAAIEVLADRVRESRADLQPMSERVARLADSQQVDELGRRIDDLAQALAAQQPSPVDLTPLTAAIADLRTHIADSRPDLAPVHERLSTVADAGQVDDLRQRVDQIAALAGQQPEPVDLEPLTSAIADLRTHVSESRPDFEALRASIDLGSIRSGIAEVVEASALQLETTERTAAELRSAIAAASADSAVDLTPIVGAVDALRHHYDETQPDLEALVEAMKAMRTQIISGVHEAADANRIDLQPLLDGIEAQRSAQESLLERVRADLAQLETSTHADGEQTRAAIEQVAQVAASPIDLGPVLEAVDAVRASIPRVDLQPVEARLESLAAAMPTVEFEPILQAVAELRDALPPATDLVPVHQAIADLREAVPPAADLTPVLDAVAEVGGRVPPPADLEPVRQAIADLAAALPPAADLDPVRDDLASLRQTIGTEIDTVRDRIDAVRDSMPSVDLGPILAAVEALRQDMPTVDLDPVLRAVESVHGDLPTVDLDPVLRAVETVHGDLPTLDLDPVLRALESVRADLPTVDLGPVLDAVDSVRRDFPEVDLARLYAQLADLASRIDAIDTSVDLGPVHQDLDSVRTAVREVEIDLTPVLEGLSDLGRRVDDTAEVERLRAAIDRVADDVAGSRAESARSEMIDQLAQRLDSLQTAVESIRADDALRDTELRLSRRVDANSESLRAKIDDQRALADGLAANVSQLNAALTLASEQPQQLRRDLDRTLEQLAERLGGAMRDLRKELDAADEPLALRSSVEAGLDRITGRFQTDTSRILEAVAAAQEDADGRLRRIDNQMTELRRAVDRARRETERLEGAPST